MQKMIRKFVVVTPLLLMAACARDPGPAQDGPAAASQSQSQGQGEAVQNRLASIEQDKAFALVRDAYIYGYPLVLMDATQRQATNVPDATAVPMRAPLNQFAHFRSYPGAEDREVVRFNFDTLYSFAWMDLRDGPVILTVPDTQGRYYLVPTLDMWTDVFSSLGSRTTGTGAGHYAYVPPGWTGTLPEGVERIEAPTSLVWLMGRTQTNGPDDYENVHKVQDGLRLTRLADWGKEPVTPVAAAVDPDVDNVTPPLTTVANMDGVAFFQRLGELLAQHPPHAADYPILFRLRQMGLAPGQAWNKGELDEKTQALIDAASKQALADITANITRGGGALKANGWNYSTESIGTYGTAYLRRATIALAGLGANLAEDAIYPVAMTDGDGQVLDGANRYVLHFDKDQLPPADAFWSLTMYDAEGFQVPNAINRFAIGDRDSLRFNTDGSLDLYIQAESPGAERESNWLPSPASGPIQPTLRLYSPRSAVTDGSWVPPAIKRL